MSTFFEGHVLTLENGWYDATVKNISEPRLSLNGNEMVNVQFALDSTVEPVFQAATAPFYDRIVMATAPPDRKPSDPVSRDPKGVLGKRVAVRISVDAWGNKEVRAVQHPSAPRTSADFRAAQGRTRIIVERDPGPDLDIDLS